MLYRKRHIKILLLCLLLFVSMSFGTPMARAQAVPGDALGEKVEKAKKFGSNALKVVKATQKILSNYQKCVAKYGNEELCQRVAIFCHIQSTAISLAYPSFVSKFQLFDAFKVNCGDGQCFQCCKTPNGGCHTSFIGFPVINCNANYGAGTFAAGITLITDPNAQPGDACLFTPQTCEHIPACLYTPDANIAQLESDLLSGKPHPINSQRAIEQRNRVFAENIQNHVGAFLSQFSSSATPNTNLEARLSRAAPNYPLSTSELSNFITGKGCKNWREHMTRDYPFDWFDPAFVITDTNGLPSEAASHWNGLVQLTTLRVLASIPNVEKRLAYVDSRVWTAQSKQAYLAQVGDPDQALLRYMSPYALEILKRVQQIQDYRLLAVPRPDEPPLGNQFNGCELGAPPQVTLKASASSGGVIQLEAALLDPEQATAFEPNHMTIDWGDGQVTNQIYPMQSPAQLSHTYTAAGKRLILVLLENNSGLRAMSTLVVEAQGVNSAQTAQTNAAPPAIGKVTLAGLTTRVETLSGNEWPMTYDLSLLNDVSDTVGSGLSPNLMIKFNGDADFGDVAIDNPSRHPFERIEIKPYFGKGFTIGFRENVLTAAGLTFYAYSTSIGDEITYTVPLTTSMVELYAVGVTNPFTIGQFNLTQPLDVHGRLKIPLQGVAGGSFRTVERIVIHLDLQPLTAMQFPPLTENLPVGTTQSWREIRPNVFVAGQSISFAPLSDRSYGDAPFPVSLSASSGLTVTLTSTTSGVCTAADNVVTVLAAGVCTLVANQPGDDRFEAAESVTRSFVVQKASQSIDFAPLPDRSLIESGFTISATASSGLDVAFRSDTPAVCAVNGRLVNLLATGLCTITANQPGDQNRLAAPAQTRSFTVRWNVFLPSVQR